MTAILRHLVELLINPFFICCVLLGFCVYWCRNKNYLQRVQRVLIIILITVLLMSTGWLPKWLTHRLEAQYPAVAQADPTIHWIVVLSGGQSQVAGMPANMLLSSASMKRLIEGVRLLRQLPNATLLISGGGYRYEKSEAENMAQLADWFAIPKQKIRLEITSINTADQARQIKSMVHNQPFYLVTSATHMPRSMQLCKEQGLHPIAAPTDFTFYWHDERIAKMMIPNTYNMMYFTVAMHEWLGQAWNTLTQRI